MLARLGIDTGRCSGVIIAKALGLPVRARLSGQAHRLGAITCLADDVEVRLSLEDHAEAQAQQLSAAAAVVVGRTANGRTDWKVQGSGVSFGAWQAPGIEQAVREGSL